MNEMMKELLKKQYFCEMQMQELCGCHSVITFEEWLEMKKKNYEWIRNELMKNKKQ